jgi:hypothetical protein
MIDLRVSIAGQGWSGNTSDVQSDTKGDCFSNPGLARVLIRLKLPSGAKAQRI